MKHMTARILIVFNAGVLLLLAAFAIVESLPGPFSDGLSARTVTALILLSAPHIAALAALGGLAPRYSVGAGSVLNAVWTLLLFFIGTGAATGIGGAAGALLFVVPLLALCFFNAIALWRRLRGREPAGT
jgi:hypothetical protein